MKSRLQQAGLWNLAEGDLEMNITAAWHVLSRLGYPARYGGRALDGSYEYVIINPRTGDYLTTGKGTTLESSMCEAALNARRLIDTG